MKKILLFAVTCTVLFVSNSFAQFPGCPAVTATTNGIVCGQNCTNLTATALGGAQTTAYTVSSITYAPPFAFNTGTPILVNIDDRWSSSISLPFHFCYFGNDYTSIIVGSNGVCSFNTANAGAFNNWNIPAGGIPNATEWPDLHNSIMGPWHDIDPTNQGQIFYEIGGTAPCRYFKVSWFNVPHYGAANSVSTGSCPGQNLRATQQIILYETTNVIDMYIQQKQFCAAWDGGVAVQGIQNANGTVAYTVPGRNGTQWGATNDAQRFTPSGAVNYTIAWFLGATQIGTGNTITVCPPSTTVYTAKATYTDCSSATPDIEVTSDVTVGFAGITTTIDSVRTISCNGGSDGAAYASFSVGSTVLSYGWSPGGAPNQTSITGIPAGTYIFSVTDGANCTRYDTVVLVDPPLLTVDVPDATIISCGGGNPTGSLTATPTGGTPGYTYSWTGGAITQTISGVSPGVYIATVTDSKGCTATDGGTITVNTTTVTFNQPVITDASCGASNGAITVSVSGATPTVTYTWSNSLPNGDTQTGLAGGTYSVTATDANGCSATASYTVGQTSAISFNAPLIEDASCAGNDGNIEVSLTGATPTVTYSWSNGLPDSDVQSGLAAGTYCVTATDGNSCTASACYTIAQGAPITFGSPVITDASCGGNDGNIVVTVSGATNPITYTWSNSLPDNDTVTVAAGTYTVTATDANGCSATASYTVGQAPAFTFGTPVITDATCAGSNGSIVVTISGAATNPIVYAWSNGLPDNDTVTGLAAGTYTLTGTDANGCSATASYTVGQSSSALTFGTPVVTDATCGGSNGSIVVTVNGATDPIVYTWSNSLPDNDTVTGLA
ncbi:MAG: SprB repeat-containing protein, partial [Chitinophagales bacterium]|nr:SprB repeat-containing protein [Chitinophagales bacterium]